MCVYMCSVWLYTHKASSASTLRRSSEGLLCRSQVESWRPSLLCPKKGTMPNRPQHMNCSMPQRP